MPEKSDRAEVFCQKLAGLLSQPLPDAESVLCRIDEAKSWIDAWPESVYVCVLNALSRLCPLTWWHCDCAVVSPCAGKVDAFCESCGSLRRLGIRLSLPVWPEYVSLLRRFMPETWFSYLGAWCQSQGLGEVVVWEGRCGVCPAEGVGAYSSKARIAAQGETSPSQEAHEAIVCIDGMRIFPNAEVVSSRWIALPLPKMCHG